ncbi:VOC family protein [Thiobacillus sedimenti]|uniref:VOC family protein n=1 Tax=Thiobacillus sedimenti TaxID=3110231 RepID=A0ABZ1CMP5_9PROT|nr:VOC family protein [Thiobacillus sp. SCUT-2]WRS40474.1 VOC family protein [Thiobacillus sp. SCUT-2]
MPDSLPSGQINGLLHAGLLVSDLARARGFYESVLGLKPCPRPELPYAGAWYELGGGQQLHLMCLPNPDAGIARPAHGGRDRHIALGVKEMAGLKSRLDAAGVTYTASQSGRAALFCRDPDMNTLEFVEIR